MDSPKLLLLVLALSGIVFFAQSEASKPDTWTRDQTSRRLLQSDIPDSCNVETNVRWFNRPPPTAYRNVTSPGSCCEFCQQSSGCRAWVWRSTGRVCYLLDTVGEERYCSGCTGGILDEPEPTDDEEQPIDDIEVDDTLQRCADEGRLAARAAATAACVYLTNTCLTAPDIVTFSVRPPPVPRRVGNVLERSCSAVFNQTCMKESFNRASEVNQPCAAILKYGPGAPTQGCEDLLIKSS